MKTTVKKQVTLKSGVVLSVGTEVSVYIDKSTPWIAQITSPETGEFKTKSKNLQYFLSDFVGFGMDDLQSAVFGDDCMSLLGDWVEPDGWDSEGFPSILLACGLV